MIVVLLITTIVVGMAFSVLHLVQRQMDGIRSNYVNNTELNLLKRSLWIDFNRYDHIQYHGGNGQLDFINEMGSTTYQFDEGMVIKARDTFHLEFDRGEFYFQYNELFEGEVDAIYLQTGPKYGGQGLFVYKTNSAATYINQ